MSTDIWKRKLQLDRDRRDKTRELMEKYDQEVYYPTLKQLQDECLANHGEHLKSTYHDNGLGWEWWYCGRCGASHSKNRYTIPDNDCE